MASAAAAGSLVDPVYLALSKLRKRQFDACIEICTRLLAENPLDQVRSTTRRYSLCLCALACVMLLSEAARGVACVAAAAVCVGDVGVCPVVAAGRVVPQVPRADSQVVH
jgi:hypothetical protein